MQLQECLSLIWHTSLSIFALTISILWKIGIGHFALLFLTPLLIKVLIHFLHFRAVCGVQTAGEDELSLGHFYQTGGI